MSTIDFITSHKVMKARPIILQISIEVNSGSVGRIAEQIGLKVIEHGWDSYITFARNNLPSKSKLIKIGTTQDVYIHGFLTRITDKHAFYSTRATKNLIQQIEIIQPDIIHLHHLHGYFINIEVLFNYFKKINTPIVWTFHDCWSFTGHCAYFDYVGCQKWEKGCFQCPQKKEYPASLLCDRSKKNYEDKKRIFNLAEDMTIVPVSHWLGGLVAKSFLNQYSVKVIQNGIDLTIFSPHKKYDELIRKYRIPEKYIILGVAGTWEKRKGLDEFMKLNMLLSENECIVLVGLSRMQINSLPDNIIGIEKTENVKELAALYSLAAVFVNPTFEDTFPTTNLESLACGTPVVTYKTGGSVESVSKETGFIVEKGNIHELFQAIMKIKVKGKNCYSAACRKRAEENYDMNHRFNDYIKLYEELIRKNHTSK